MAVVDERCVELQLPRQQQEGGDTVAEVTGIDALEVVAVAGHVVVGAAHVGGYLVLSAPVLVGAELEGELQLVAEGGVVDDAVRSLHACHVVQVDAVAVVGIELVLEAEALLLVEGPAVGASEACLPVAVDVDGLRRRAPALLVVDHARGHGVVGAAVVGHHVQGVLLRPAHQVVIAHQTERPRLLQVGVRVADAQRVADVAVVDQRHDVGHAGAQRGVDVGPTDGLQGQVVGEPVDLLLLLRGILDAYRRVQQPVVLRQLLAGLAEVVERLALVVQGQLDADVAFAQEAGLQKQGGLQLLVVVLAGVVVAVGRVEHAEQGFPGRRQQVNLRGVVPGQAVQAVEGVLVVIIGVAVLIFEAQAVIAQPEVVASPQFGIPALRGCVGVAVAEVTAAARLHILQVLQLVVVRLAVVVIHAC